MACRSSSLTPAQSLEQYYAPGAASPTVGLLGCAWAEDRSATQTGVLTAVQGMPGQPVRRLASTSLPAPTITHHLDLQAPWNLEPHTSTGILWSWSHPITPEHNFSGDELLPDWPCLESRCPMDEACEQPLLLLQTPPDLRDNRTFLPDYKMAEGHIKFVAGDSEWSEDEKELVLQAWALLMVNQDLIIWAGCLFGEKKSRTKNLIKKLTEWCCLDNKIDIYRWQYRGGYCDDENYNHDSACSYPGKNKIHITMSSNDHVRQLMTHIMDSLYTGYVGEACAAISLAYILHHELCHIVKYDDGQSHPGFKHSTGDRTRGEEADLVGEQCDLVAIIANALGWALLQRYSAVASFKCCADWEQELREGIEHVVPGNDHEKRVTYCDEVTLMAADSVCAQYDYRQLHDSEGYHERPDDGVHERPDDGEV